MFQCNQCDKVFSHKKDYNRHKLVHSEEGKKSLCCKYCGKTYSSKSNLKIHEQTCAKNKNRQFLSCKFCVKKFGHKGHLKEHEMLHRNPEVFKCDACGKCFAYKSNMNTHKKQVHKLNI
jgi:KRAB domain-containing zinc finger protein